MVMQGPLAPWASGMAEHLKTLGYARRPAARHMELTGKLSRFLQERGLGTSHLSPDVLEEFTDTVRTKGASSRLTPKALGWLVGYLRDIGVMPAPSAPLPQSRGEELVERYRHFLITERGLAPETVVEYSRAAGLFLTEHPDRELEDLGVAEVSRFMTRHCRVLSPKSAQRLATGLRSFLGFALLEGLIAAPLAGAVPSAARWSGASLPRGLAPGQVAALLASCDRRQATGRRDYAILVLLARLGLRAAEVAALRLDDIDWRAGVVVVRGKGRTEERLPLPSDVGAAIAAYLRRGRPRRPEREVFLRALAPLRPQPRWGERGGAGSQRARRARQLRVPSSSPHGGNRDAASRGVTFRSGPSPAPSQRRHHRHLRQSRSSRVERARHAVAGRRVVTDFCSAAADYLATRRAMGYKLAYHSQMLGQFVAYLDAVGAEHLTIAHALSWAKQPPDAAPVWWAAKLGMVRGFARYLNALDLATEVPPVGLLPEPSHRIVPYIYSDEDIARLLEAAGRLSSEHRADTYRTLIGLVAVTGMRAGEAARLDQDDVDFGLGLLTIRNSKCGKSRQLPLHPSTLKALAAYGRRRDERRPKQKAPSFFTSATGTRLLRDNVSTVFPRLVRDAGLEWPHRSRPPRLHDLRHTFAVRCLVGWYRDGLDVEPRLPRLSTYLGHIAPSSTYWYLSAVPELLELIAGRLDTVGDAER